MKGMAAVRGAAAAVLCCVTACAGPAAAPGTPAATAAPGQQVYADSFASPSSGWPAETNSDHVLAYGTSGGRPAYIIRTLSAGSSVQVSSPVNSLPHALTIDVTLTVDDGHGGAGGGDAGVGCDEGGNGYALILQAGGAFAVQKETGGVLGAIVASGAAGTTAAIAVPPAENALSLACTPGAGGVRVTATVNGTQVGSVMDTTPLPAGGTVQVWLRGDSNSGESDAAFTALRVIAG